LSLGGGGDKMNAKKLGHLLKHSLSGGANSNSNDRIKAWYSLIFTYSLGEPYVYLSVEAESERRRFIKVLDEIQHDVILGKKRAPRGVLFNIKRFSYRMLPRGSSSSITKDSFTS
jgi:hypothetical protein